MRIDNALVLGFDKPVSVSVAKGKITYVGTDRLEDSCIVDACNNYLFPAAIDMNIRLKNNLLNRKNLDLLIKDMIRGGVGTALLCPDFSPRLDNETILEFLCEKLENQSVNLSVLAPLINPETQKLNNISTLINNGARAVQTHSHMQSNLIRRGAQYVKMKDVPFFVQCHDFDLDDNGVMNEGKISHELGLLGISKISEISEVARLVEIGMYYDISVVFQSLSTIRSIELVNEAKLKGANLYSEISIHHLCKDDSSCLNFNTYAKIRPPLRNKEEKELLIEALKNNKIDFITSLHSPKSMLYKDIAFEDAAFGIHAAADLWSLSYSYLVKEKIISIDKLVELVSLNPAKLLGLNKGKIDIGYDADMLLFDPKFEYKMKVEKSIYENQTLFGKIDKLWIDGKIVKD